MSDKAIKPRPVSPALSDGMRRNFKPHALYRAMSSAFNISEVELAEKSGRQHVLSATAFDKGRQIIENHLQALINPPSPASLTYRKVDKTLQEKLFDATAEVKILTSQVAMHLDCEWRNKLFSQLDSIHDPAEWVVGDQPVRQASFATFLKAIVQLRPQRRPGLGLTYGGNLIAAWTKGLDRLTIEFLPSDRVRWVIARHYDDETERFAGQSAVSRLSEGLAPYHPESWFST